MAAAAGAALFAIAAAAVCAPLLTALDPSELAPAVRLRPPGEAHPLGTDAYGRDVLARLLYGGRVSLAIGLGAAVFATLAGLALGLLAGTMRRLDALVMRMMDALMAIPAILLAIAVVALWGGGLVTVMVAITLPEVPRMARLVRSMVLSAREQPYVEVAVTLGSAPWKIALRHLLPGTAGPLLVQATYVCASAILLESMLSFLGAGIDPDVPTWGNMMADGRLYLQLYPGLVLWPGLVLTVTILAINILGDAARDRLDPRMSGRGALR